LIALEASKLPHGAVGTHSPQVATGKALPGDANMLLPAEQLVSALASEKHGDPSVLAS